MSIKVLHICQRDDPGTGGAVRVAVEYVKHLVANDIDAHCLFLYGEPGIFQKELGVERSHYLRIMNSRDIFRLWYFPKFINTFQPDIIHSHDGLTWPRCFLFFFQKTTRVTHAHSDIPPYHSLIAILNVFFQRFTTDFCICITQYIQNNWIKNAGYQSEKTAVIYNGVDSEQFYHKTVQSQQDARIALRLPQEIKLVGFVGRLDCQMKGADDFLRVIANLPQNYVGVLAGSGPDETKLIELAKNLNISDRTVFLGLQKKMARVYHAIDILCVTSHWEPFGLVVIESLACRTDVVAFSCPGGINEILLPVKNKVMIPDRSTTSMATQILQILETRKSYTSYLDQSYLQGRFSWEKSSFELIKVYRNLLNISLEVSV